MRVPLLIVLAVFIHGTVSALATMNTACKSSPHAWCAPMSTTRHHAKIDKRRVTATRDITSGSSEASSD